MRCGWCARARAGKVEQENRRLLKKLDEMRTLSRAKCALVRYCGMTEAQAHHALEQRAMDVRISLRDAALAVLNTYGRPEAFPAKKAGQRRPAERGPCPLPQGPFLAQPGPARETLAHAAGFNKGKRVRHLWKKLPRYIPIDCAKYAPDIPQAKREAYFGLPRQVQFAKNA